MGTVVAKNFADLSEECKKLQDVVIRQENHIKDLETLIYAKHDVIEEQREKMATLEKKLREANEKLREANEKCSIMLEKQKVHAFNRH